MLPRTNLVPRLTVVIALVLAGIQHMTETASAQVTTCQLTALHHLNCSQGGSSAPNEGKWAWNPGSFSGITGDVHWWIDWRWTDNSRLTELRNTSPRYEVEFYKPKGPWGVTSCGCGNIKVLRLRTIGHLNSPPPNSLRFSVSGGDCIDRSPDKSLAKIKFVGNKNWATLNTEYDISVDADMISNDSGEANLSWQLAQRFRVDCEVWLGKIEYCPNGLARGSDPGGILCSTSSFTQCNWSACPH